MPSIESLAPQFSQLAPGHKRQVHFHLCHHALEVLEHFFQSAMPIRYRDSVVGLDHEVDQGLPRDALACAAQGASGKAIAQRYLEPIAALQDGDLAFPAHIESAYDALYNVFKKYSQHTLTDDWLIVDQALAAETDAALQEALLRKAIRAADIQEHRADTTVF